MSDIIHLLPDSVANQIAAGEVIQRPASVVKELVENAIDAGATEIQIFIKDAGRTLIQVVDNGKGMSETDARLSFERHATSKISSAQDLYSLRTMGFRGEALASIAAIAQVELRTRRAEDEIGTSILISGSKVESQEYVSCPAGANFMIKNIFFNVPARRKFLKSNQVEFGFIMSEFERMALVNTDIAFKLVHNDVELYNLPASNFRQRIVSLFGKNLNQHLLSVDVQTSLVSITGYIGHPDSARKRNAWQYFFVNGRYMRHPYFYKAVISNYEQLLPAGEMRHYFDKCGGNLGQNGCVSYLFTKKGQIVIDNSEGELDEEKVMEDCFDAGAEDVDFDEDTIEVYTGVNELREVREALEKKGYTFLSAEPAYIPSTYTALPEDAADKMTRLMDLLDDCDDVQGFWHNWEM